MADPEGFKLGSAWMDVKPNVDDAAFRSRLAAGLEPALADVGRDGGLTLSDSLGKGFDEKGFEDTLGKKTKEPAKRKGDESGAAFTSQFKTQLDQGLSASALGGVGSLAGGAFTAKFNESVKTGLTSDSLFAALGPGGTEALAKTEGERAGFNFTDAFGGRVRQDLPPQLEKPLEDSGGKGGDAAGKAAGKSFGDGISPLIKTAFAAAAVAGPALLLTGTAAALGAMGSLVLRSNDQIKGEYQRLGQDVSASLQGAVAPLAPAVEGALASADAAMQKITPDLKKIFTDVAPDVSNLTSGVEQLVEHALPGIESAMGSSRGIVADFSSSLPRLGDGLGNLFSGLVGDANRTGQGISSFVDVASNALGTLGKVGGDLSTTLSTDFTAITPALNGALGVIKDVSSPATLGGVVGLFGAMKLDPLFSTGLTKASDGMLSVAANAEKAAGPTSKLAGAALGTATGFSKAADVIGGPWGLAVGAGIGLLTGFLSTQDKMTSSASDFTSAVNQDSGVVGQNTVATIQNQLAKEGLLGLADKLGVSQAQLVEAAAGEAGAQQIVADAYKTKDKALRDAIDAGTVGLDQGNQQVLQLEDQKNAFDQLTRSVVDATNEDRKANEATLAANSSAEIFSATITDLASKQQLQAQQNAMGAVAALGLGASQSGLTTLIYNSLDAYSLATAGASAYGSTLNSLNGTAASVDDAQNALAQSMLNAKTSFAQNQYSLDRSTQAGINNREALSAASKQIIAMGVDQFQASGNIDQANQTIQEQVDAYVKATGATGKAKTAIENYLLSITKIPSDVATVVHANTSDGKKTLQQFVDEINTSSGTVTIYGNATSAGSSLFAKGAGAHAGGGPLYAYQPSTYQEHGEETIVSTQDAYVLTHGQTTALQSQPASKAATIVNFNYYGPQAPSPEQQADMMRQLGRAVGV